MGGRCVVEITMSLRVICMRPCTTLPADGIGALKDPLLLALLDVGFLTPKWTGLAGPRLVLANKLTRSLLLAWADAQCAELPWRQRVECHWWLWWLQRNGRVGSAVQRPPRL